ncbi:MAG: hypothetical protein HY682_05530 [Chloroflexi bacterium]|nr:hypothetical protein [Chloroflexota bacterium]
MAVKVLIKKTGATITGKFAVLEKDAVGLFSGITSDKKGGFRGCGKKSVFAASDVTVQADNPATEVKRK